MRYLQTKRSLSRYSGTLSNKNFPLHLILRKNVHYRLKLIRGYNLYIWIALIFCSSKEKFFLPFLGRQPFASCLPHLTGPLQKLLFINLLFQTHQFSCFAFLRKAERNLLREHHCKSQLQNSLQLVTKRLFLQVWRISPFSVLPSLHQLRERADKGQVSPADDRSFTEALQEPLCPRPGGMHPFWVHQQRSNNCLPWGNHWQLSGSK